jgi:5'-deoxynucleotidase YfbR-like HD superfamily hydrolase
MKEFLKKIESLDNIHQWEERDSVIKETVSQHCYKVAAICHYLLHDIELQVDKVGMYKDEALRIKLLSFKYNCLSYAIMHDFDESILGRDISHTIKYNEFNGEVIRKALDEYVMETTRGNFNGIYVVPSYEVRTFVKLCDWIALYTFIKRNNRMGVKTFKKEKTYCWENIESKIAEVKKVLTSMFDYDFSIKVNL